MKASQKTILLVGLTVIDCIVGGVIIRESLARNPKSEANSVEMLDLNGAEGQEPEVTTLVMEEKVPEPQQPEIIVEEEEVEEVVYDGLTLEELAQKLDRSLKGTIAGKGELIASYSLEKGVDPYIATAIMLHETGCTWNCSTLVKKCNNVGGQKGSGCGSYRSFKTLEAGIKGFIDNLSKNYFSKGLDTPKEINKKYAEDKNWYKKVESYVKKIKNK